MPGALRYILTRWLSILLKKQIVDVVDHMRSSCRLCGVIQLLEGRKLTGVNWDPKTSSAEARNVSLALDILRSHPSCRLVNLCQPNELLAKDVAAHLGVCSEIFSVYVYHVEKVKSVETIAFYNSVLFRFKLSVDNLGADFRNGQVLSCVCHAIYHDSFPMESLKLPSDTKANALFNNDKALSFLHKKGAPVFVDGLDLWKMEFKEIFLVQFILLAEFLQSQLEIARGSSQSVSSPQTYPKALPTPSTGRTQPLPQSQSQAAAAGEKAPPPPPPHVVYEDNEYAYEEDTDTDEFDGLNTSEHSSVLLEQSSLADVIVETMIGKDGIVKEDDMNPEDVAQIDYVNSLVQYRLAQAGDKAAQTQVSERGSHSLRKSVSFDQQQSDTASASASKAATNDRSTQGPDGMDQRTSMTYAEALKTVRTASSAPSPTSSRARDSALGPHWKCYNPRASALPPKAALSKSQKSQKSQKSSLLRIPLRQDPGSSQTASVESGPTGKNPHFNAVHWRSWVRHAEKVDLQQPMTVATTYRSHSLPAPAEETSTGSRALYPVPEMALRYQYQYRQAAASRGQSGAGNNPFVPTAMGNRNRQDAEDGATPTPTPDFSLLRVKAALNPQGLGPRTSRTVAKWQKKSGKQSVSQENDLNNYHVAASTTEDPPAPPDDLSQVRTVIIERLFADPAAFIWLVDVCSLAVFTELSRYEEVDQLLEEHPVVVRGFRRELLLPNPWYGHSDRYRIRADGGKEGVPCLAYGVRRVERADSFVTGILRAVTGEDLQQLMALAPYKLEPVRSISFMSGEFIPRKCFILTGGLDPTGSEVYVEYSAAQKTYLQQVRQDFYYCAGYDFGNLFDATSFAVSVPEGDTVWLPGETPTAAEKDLLSDTCTTTCAALIEHGTLHRTPTKI